MSMRRFAAVTLFEFRRHLDVRGELVGLLLLVVIALLKLVSDSIVTREASSTVTVLAEGTSLAGMREGRFVFADQMPEGIAHRYPVLNKDESGYTLHVARPPSWLDELSITLGVLQHRHELASLGVTAIELQAIDSRQPIRVVGFDGHPLRQQGPLAALSIALVVLTTLSILGCLGMLFNGLLGERFGHATEMILSAVPACFWLDCKVTSSILHGLKTIAVYGTYSLVGWILFQGSLGDQILPTAGFAAFLASLFAFCLLGLTLWNWFFAACAAVIRSPHSAFRNSLAAFPLTMIIIGLGGMRAPEGGFMQLLSHIPFTSMAAMPVRMLYVDVPTWELLLSLGWLAVSALTLRFCAERSFQKAIVAPAETISSPAAPVR
ncbi:TPA: ABC transporter permease [Stenotrophomonas maltophilia]|nr:ABC transporter permease [Stenotrophomonas maltophilia]HEL3751599.1 ABC transporter permease [Stenotrophomonas maltophilia]HEL7730477.1 ABC transporter permease [Stenotrophomonas maltophilia]